MKRDLPIKKDHRGELLPFYAQDYGFDWNRCFIIKNSPLGTVRGNHGHRRESQLLLVINGSIELVSDDGYFEESLALCENEYVILPPLTWNTFKITETNTTILVVGSEVCDEEEYIRDYDEFVKLVKENDG